MYIHLFGSVTSLHQYNPVSFQYLVNLNDYLAYLNSSIVPVSQPSNQISQNLNERHFPPKKHKSDQVNYRLSKRRKQFRKQKKERKLERQDDFERKNQKRDRNLPSNMLKHFIVLLFTQSTFNLFKSHLSHPNFNYLDYSQLTQKIASLINIKAHYLKPLAIKQLCNSDRLTPEENLFMRMTLKYFLQNFLPLHVICSRRLKKLKKLDTLSRCRTLLKDCLERREATSRSD